MKTFTKKFLSILLAVLMIMSTVPFMALPIFAEEGSSVTPGASVNTEEPPRDLTEEEKSMGIFVSANGSDSNAGTIDAPVKTLAKAYSLVANGGTIYVKNNVSYSTKDGGKFELLTAKKVTLTSCNAEGQVGPTINNTITCTYGDCLMNIDHADAVFTSTNITIDFKGTGGGRAFRIIKGTVNVGSGTVVKNCYASSYGGGAIYLGAAKLYVDGAVFENNKSDDYGGVLRVDNNSAVVSFKNTTFTNNKVPKATVGDKAGYGGALGIKAAGSVTIENCVFTGNTAVTSGGAVHSTVAMRITNSVFSGNSSTKNGGAVMAKQRAVVDGCTFTDNTSGGNGAAMAIELGGNVVDIEITDSFFGSNKATGKGGAICTSADSNGNVYLDSSVFTGNSGSYGGAIYSSNVVTRLREGTYIFGNSATTLGGGIGQKKLITCLNDNASVFGNTVNGVENNIEFEESAIIKATSDYVGYAGVTVAGAAAGTKIGEVGNKDGVNYTITGGYIKCDNAELAAVVDGTAINWAAASTPKYIVLFMLGNTALGSSVYSDASEVEEPDIPVKVGFVGTFGEYTLGEGNIIVEAEYVQGGYTIIYKNENGETVGEAEYDYSDEKHSKAPEVPAKTGYTGVWADYEITSDRFEVLPVYTAIEYTIYFKVGEEIIGSDTFSGDDHDRIVPPSLESYNSAETTWYWPEYSLDGIYEDYTLEAMSIATSGLKYATFVADGVTVDTVPFAPEKTELEFYLIPEIPAKAGYTWKWDDYTLNGENITINAIYTPIVYTATFVDRDGTTVIGTDPFTVEDAKLDCPAVPEVAGYTIVWGSYTIGAGDITVTAVYTAIKYTVTFMADETVVDTLEFDVENMTVTLPEIPAKDGFEFARWSGCAPAATELTMTAFENTEISAIYKTWTLIYNKADLEAFRTEVANDAYSYGKLMNDVDLNGSYVQIGGNVKGCNNGNGSSWNSLGKDAATGFSGIFDGQGYAILNYYAYDQYNVRALFSYVKGATIKNLTLNASIRGNAGTGGIVGVSDGVTIENCAYNGVISIAGGHYCIGGGFIAQITGGANVIRNSYATGVMVTTYTGSGYLPLSAFVGKKGGGSLTIENCINATVISDAGGSNGNVHHSTFIGDGSGTVTNSYYTNTLTKIGNPSANLHFQGTASSMEDYYNGKLAEKINTAAGETIWEMETTHIAIGYIAYRSTSPTYSYLKAVAPTWADDEVEPEYSIKGASLELNGSINIVFLVPKSSVPSGATLAMKAVNLGKAYDLEQISITVDGVACYGFRLSAIAAKQMGDEYVAVLTVDGGNGEIASKIVEYSVLNYATRMLAKDDTDANLKSAIVAMLNYGAAAQTYFTYNTDALVNAGLTDDQKALDDTFESAADAIIAGEGNSTNTNGILTGASLTLDGTVSINLILTGNTYTVKVFASLEDAEALAEITDSKAQDDKFVYTFSDIYASDLGTTYYVRVYDAEGTQVDSVAYSAYDYAIGKKADADANLVALTKALVAYGEASRTFFGIE